MKMRFIWIFLVSMGFLSVSVADNNLPIPNTTPLKSINGIAATVNSEIITEQQLDHALYAARQQFQHNNVPLPDSATLRKEVLQQLIYQHLQLEIAKRNKITVSDKEVDQAISHLAAENHATISQLKEKLAQQGLSYTGFRKQLRKQLIITKLQREAILSNIHINKSDINAFRQEHATETNPMQYHVAHILIPLPDSPSPAQIKQTKAKAEAVLKQLRAGKSFDSFADNYAGSGDLGWRALEDLPAIFANPISTMKPGSFSSPIRAANGFHILKLEGKQQKDAYSDQQIQSLMTQQKFEKALKKWLDQLYKSAYIHINN